jgi:hypothetical protein
MPYAACIIPIVSVRNRTRLCEALCAAVTRLTVASRLHAERHPSIRAAQEETMSNNAIPLDRLKWVQLSSEDRDAFRTWGKSESREPPETSARTETKPGFGRRIQGPLPLGGAPSLRRKDTGSRLPRESPQEHHCASTCPRSNG